jgi:hypothetical protein
MPERRSQSFIFPLLLILLGLGLLLDQLGVWAFSWEALLRLWPLALILIGLDMVLSRTRVGGLVSLLIVVALVVLLLGFYRPFTPTERGSTHETYNQPAQGIETATLHVQVDNGKLTMSALEDSPNFFEAEVNYDKGWTNVSREVSVEGNAAEVYLKSKIRERGWVPVRSGFKEEWTIQVNPTIVTQLDIATGVGQADLNLSGMKLGDLRLNTGVGGVNVTLSAQGAYAVVINGGVGSVTVNIPRDAEARIQVEKGIGSLDVDSRFVHQDKYYVSKGYGSAKNKIDLDIDGGVGAITVH